MSSKKEPVSIKGALEKIERRRLERKDDFLRSVAERRRNAEGFEELKNRVILPVLRELRRELGRRRHLTKLVEKGASVVLTVGISDVALTQGSLRLRTRDTEPGVLEIEYLDTPVLGRRYSFPFEEVDEDLVSRAALRLVHALSR